MPNFSSLAGLEVTEKFVGGGGGVYEFNFGALILFLWKVWGFFLFS